jgi:hypothetical protein
MVCFDFPNYFILYLKFIQKSGPILNLNLPQVSMYRILFLILLFIISIHSQDKISGYQESDQKLKFTFQPAEFNLARLTDDIKLKKLSYYDESRPGELSLPSKSLFVAIPPGAEVTVDFRIVEKRTEDFNPSINPEASLTRDTTIHLNFEPELVLKNGKREVIEILGYFEIKGVRVVHLKFNQYDYNFSSAKLDIISKIEFTLNPNKPVINYNSGIVFSDEAKKMFSGMLVNPDAINKFSSVVAVNDTTGNWIDFSAPYVKIGVAKDGIYRVFGSDLQGMGVNLSEIQPTTLQLLKKGLQQDIFVFDGSDSRFDATDYIEFLGERNMGSVDYRTPNAYGVPYNEYYDRFTDTTVYWITWNRSAGKRVTTAPQTLGVASDTLKSYTEMIHQEVDRSYLYFDANLVRREMPYYFENKTFYWQNLNAPTTMASRSYTFSLSGLDTTDSVRFYARIASGASSNATGSHSLVLQVGNNFPTYDSSSLDRYGRIVLSGTSPGSLFANGNNTIKVVSYPNGTSINTVWIDWVEVEYQRNLKVTNDSLTFKFPFSANQTTKNIQLTNVTSDSLIFWKTGSVTKKMFVSRNGNSLVVQDTVSKSDKYYLVKNASVLKPTLYYKKNWRNLRNPSNKADYLAVSIEPFALPIRQHLAYLKNSNQLDTMFIDMNDVYDEFSFGYFSTMALKEFFRATQSSWQTPYPDYAILVGSANWDIKLSVSNILNIKPKYNLVPSYGFSVSDNLLAVFDTVYSLIPQILLGRIPAKTIEEVDRYFIKLSKHYNQRYDRFNKRVLLLSGGVDESQATEFKGQNTVLSSYFKSVPYSFDYNQYFRTFSPVSNYGPFPLDEVDANIKKGGVILSYVGHSGTFHWDNDIRTPSQLLNNANKGSLLTDFGCSTGKFGEPDVDCFAEQFLLYPTGQPIAYISNSSLGFTSTAAIAPNLFYTSMLVDSLWKPSEALRTAKIKMFQQYGNSSTNQLFAMTNTYFGDPFLELKIPGKPNFIYENEAITLTPKNPDDTHDSVKLSLVYFNYGTALNENVDIRITDRLNGETVFDTVLTRPVPTFRDSMAISIPVKNRLGVHAIKATLNGGGRIPEIYDNDNMVETSFIVSSSISRDYLKYNNENLVKDFLYFINPQRKPNIESVELQIADNALMTNSTQLTVPFDSFYTKVSLASFPVNKRYWFRVKDNVSGQFGAIRSFFLSNQNGFGLTDSISFDAAQFVNSGYKNGALVLQDKSVNLSISAAGYYDGNSAVISHNGNNTLVSNTVLSHNVAVFEAATMEFLYVKSFNLTFGDANTERILYKALLDTLDESKIIVIAAAYDPYSGTDAELRGRLKAYGSTYIDSVRVRDSWFMVGRKNALTGSLPEKWKKANQGQVTFDTTYIFSSTSGSLLTNSIGPVSSWEKMEVQAETPDSTTLRFRIVGTTVSGITDTTVQINGSNNIYDLSIINGKGYNTIKVLADLESIDKKSTPQISSLIVGYDDFTEVGTNYQSVSISADTVLPNADINISFNVTNGSETAAKNFKVKVEAVIGANPASKIFEQVIDSLGVFSSRPFSVNYKTPLGSGASQIIITIDPENVLKEFYRDNNSYSVPFYIKADTSKPFLTLSIDGAQVSDGEYINPKAEIKLELYDFSSIPLQDTSTISMKLNGAPLFFQSLGVSHSFSNTNPKVTVLYKPEFKDGDYEFSVVARGNSSSFADTARVDKKFSVMNEAKVLNVYNYPNPFQNETYFTFKLTQIPDEFKIIIYTVAGRKIREIVVPSSQMKYDFNKIHWDGRDEDGDLVANGVYLYRLVMKRGDKVERITEKLAIVR